jgi:hypothetical protein
MSKHQYLDRGLTPPDESGKAYDQTERLIEFMEWIKKNYKPEQIFDYADLEFWAISNGFILPDTTSNKTEY